MANRFTDQLKVARDHVNQEILKKVSWQELEPSVTEWFRVFKQWEGDDNFDDAFEQDRMTMRITKSETPKDPPSFVKGASWDTQAKTYKLTSTLTEPKADLIGIERKHFMQRADPTNFANPGDKLTKGLLEMPCQLLNHSKKIVAQVFPVSTTGWAVFMPVCAQADMTLYYSLREITKTNLAAAQKMREIRSKMTRIKLAQDHDMHTGVSAVTDKGDGRKHYRYGLTGTEPDSSSKSGFRNITLEERKARFDIRLNYQAVLLSEGVYNETVLAYRQHASAGFPLFVDWVGLTNIPEIDRSNAALRLKVVNVDNNPTGQFVTNVGKLV